MRSAIAALKFFFFLLQVVWLLPFQILILLITRGKAAYIIPQLWHSIVRRIFGIRVNVIGTPYTGGSALFISNHISYLDITVLGSVIRGSFVAKQEVKGWVLFGLLARLQQTGFIQRTRKGTDAVIRNDLAAMVAARKNLIIFPEGTSTDGQSVFPFKSSLFALPLQANNPELTIQPVTVRVEQSDGKPILSQEDRDIYSWHVNMDDDLDVGTHLWRFARKRGAVVSLIFHKPLKAKDYTDRKILCHDCYNAVSSGLSTGQVA